MRVDPESVYLEPAGAFLLDRETGVVTAPQSVCIHWKEGARWQRMVMLPDEGETFGELLHRLGDWIEAEPQTWTSELLHGSGRTMSGDSR